jgi:pyruvate/2-oxoglutarate dehydrogenase complex dihydrolipoamide acyltransferase (E2) component
MSHEVIMPALGMAQDTGLLVAWHKQPGDAIKVGDVLMDVETDKSTMEVEAQAAGFLCDVRAFAGEDVPVGNVIAVIAAQMPTGAAAAASERPADPPVQEVVAAPIPSVFVPPISTPPLDQSTISNAPKEGRKILASPKAKRLAHEAGLDLSALVQAGLPQPFRATDIETFQALPAPVADPDAQGTTLSYGPSASHIAARVPSDAFDSFIQRMADDGGIALDTHVVWASFAARATRASVVSDKLVVEVQDKTGSVALKLLDPDQSRLSAPNPAPSDAVPSLILRDLTGSPIVGLNLAADLAAAFSVNATGPVFEIGFAFSEIQIAAPDAMQIVALFAEQLENPMLHLV